MKIKCELQPTLTKNSKDRYLISFWYNQKRFRFSSGTIIGLNLYPNQVPEKKRREEAELLLSAFKVEIKKGWKPIIKTVQPTVELTTIDVCKKVLGQKLKLNYSISYKNDLIRTTRCKSSA